MEISIKTVKLSVIKLNPDNPRQINKTDLERLVKSLQDFPEMMQLREIVVDENMVILGGNMRYRALKQTGAKECIAKIVKGLTPEQKREFIVKDNSSFGEWNLDLLSGWDDLPLVEWGVGLPEDWLAAPAGEPADAEPQIDKAEELNKTWKVKTGDLFTIGDHRLLCGDSTKAEDVARVMGGEKADMVFTDPPYGMSLDISHSDDIGSKGKWTSKPKGYTKVIGDNEDFSSELITTIFDNFSYSKEIFIWGADYFSEFIPNRQDGSWIVWDKRAGVEDMKLTFSEFELCWSKAKHLREIARITWSGLLGTEQEFDHKRHHPTQKPIKLSTWFIEKYSKENDIITDIYAGAGFTMVACQNLNRKCRGLEISPEYCSVILQRMQDAFGITGERIEDGQKPKK